MKLFRSLIYISTLIFFLFKTNYQYAQDELIDPTDWSTNVEVKGDDIFLVTTAKLDKGWHLYSQKLDPDKGPIPTEFTYKASSQYEKIGNTSEPKGITEFDKNFDVEVTYFKDKVHFSQKIKRKTPDAFSIQAEVFYMVCDDSKCLPPELVELSFNVPTQNKDTEKEESTDSEESPDEPEENKHEVDQATMEDQANDSEGFETPESVTDWEIYTEKISDNLYKLHAKVKLKSGWHTYSNNNDPMGPIPTDFLIDSAYGTSDGKIEEIGKVHEVLDSNFGEPILVKEYKNEAVFIQNIKTINNDTLKGSILYMVCENDKCLPPANEYFIIDLKTGKTISVKEPIIDSPTDKGTKNSWGVFANLDKDNPIGNCGNEVAQTEEKEEKKSLWLQFLFGLIGGLIALLTPCMYPMIPLTVSFFTKGDSDRKKGIGRASLYGFFIFFLYFLISVPFHVTDADPEVLNGIATSTWLNLSFFFIFMFFAFSFFGYYELTLPSKWVNRADSASNSGGVLGILFMALTLTLVSFSCTGPILGSVLAGVLQEGPAPLSATMAGFGIGIGLPFAIFAAFPSLMKSLPQSGGWMNELKVVLGFIEVALALKFLSNADLSNKWGAIKIEVFLGVWILVSLGIVLYLLGFIRFPHDGKGKKKMTPIRLAFIGIFLASAVYLATGFRYNEKTNSLVTLKILNGVAPPTGYSILYPIDCPQALNCYKDLAVAREAAISENKMLLIDFTGHNCANCRKVEETIWSDEKVWQFMNDKVIIASLYVDDHEVLPEDQQFVQHREYKKSDGTIKIKKKKIKTIGDKWNAFEIEKFKIASQPYYALVSTDGELLIKPTNYTQIREEGGAEFYLNWLKCGYSTLQGLKK